MESGECKGDIGLKVVAPVIAEPELIGEGILFLGLASSAFVNCFQKSLFLGLASTFGDGARIAPPILLSEVDCSLSRGAVDPRESRLSA